MVLGNVTGGINKKTKGRKKIEIKKIEETNSRQVTFSKRRIGLFKKASEVCILTGAQIAILVNSPGGRFFAFGHPNVDDLVDRYLDRNTAGADAQKSQVRTEEFNQHYGEVSRELEAEKKKIEITPGRIISGSGLSWYDESIDDLNVEELEPYLCSLVELKNKVVTRADELMMIKKAPTLMETNNNIQTMDIPTNTAVYGGFNNFNIQHGGEVWKY